VGNRKRFVWGALILSALAATASLAYASTYTIIDASTFGINTKGDIVGAYFIGGGGPHHGFLLHRGTFSTLDVPGTLQTAARGINPQGDIVGDCNTSAGGTHGFLLHEGSYQTIVDPPGSVSTVAVGINSQGDIVGDYDDAAGRTHGFLLHEGGFTIIDIPGAFATYVFGINGDGDIVGASTPGDARGVHSFLFRNGVFTTIDVPGAFATYAAGINTQGDIAGTYTHREPIPVYPYFGYPPHGFLVHKGKFTTIDLPGSTSTQVLGINDRGSVVGIYTDGHDVQHGFLVK